MRPTTNETATLPETQQVKMAALMFLTETQTPQTVEGVVEFLKRNDYTPKTTLIRMAMKEWVRKGILQEV